MNRDDPWGAVARECPCRILACLHRSGRYAHGSVPGLPGKVLCVHAGATRPPGWAPTPAQEAAERADLAARADWQG